MIYKTKSKEYQKMLAILSKLAGKKYDPNSPSATKITRHKSGSVFWKLYWSLEIRNDTQKEGEDVWKFRLEVTPQIRVNKKTAKLDFTTMSPERLFVAKQSLLVAKLTGPFFKGYSARNMKEFENGKAMLWGQMNKWKLFYSTLKDLKQKDLYSILDNEFPAKFKELIAQQK